MAHWVPVSPTRESSSSAFKGLYDEKRKVPISGCLLLCERARAWSSRVATVRKSLVELWEVLPDTTGRASQAGLILGVETNVAPCVGESKGFSELLCPPS